MIGRGRPSQGHDKPKEDPMDVSRVRRALLLAVLAILVGGTAVAATRWSELSDGQRDQLRDLRERLDEQGADRATCRAEHDKLFRSWGLEPPAGPPEGRGPHGRRGMGPAGNGPDLTQEQRQALRDLRDKLDEQGANRATCRAEHDKLFRSWGLEPPAGPPEGRGPHGCRGMGMPGDGPELTKEQRQALRDLRDKLDEQDADPQTCRAEHDKLFRSWGLEPPAGPPVGRGRGPCGEGMGRGRGPGACRMADAGGDRALAAPDDGLAAGKSGEPALGLGNHPNPFNPETTIQFQLPEPASVRLTVFDLQGAQVRSLELGRLEAGSHQTVWDGQDSQGRPAASGTYLYRLDLPGRSETGRMTLLR
jgi:Spy/CpxP family protein refolding chaperone